LGNVEAGLRFKGVTRKKRREIAKKYIELVGLNGFETAFPHQLSGGMLQRAMIAAALSCQPSLLIADEPTTALDVTTAAQILDLMGQLQDEMGMAIMHVSHNLGVVAEVANEVAVMYLGRIVERSSVDDLFYNPKHPYTRGLMHSIPQIGQRQRLEPIRGVVPEPDAIPKGCAFAPRCPLFSPATCPPIVPPIVTVGPGHEVLCYRYDS